MTANTYGGYVNVSRQDIDWSTPSIMDLVITDLAAQYGIVTEAAFGAALVAGRDRRHDDPDRRTDHRTRSPARCGPQPRRRTPP